EHGLHNWFGFYDNAFRQARAVYEEWQRIDKAGPAPLDTFEHAFRPVDEAVFVERIAGAPRLWVIHNPSNDLKPGEGGLWPSLWAYVEEGLQLIKRWVRGMHDEASRGHPLLARLDAA